MLAHSHNFPHLRQRFIELYNAGDVEIPAYAVCEIVGSVRPDTGGSWTPSGGRTVLQVRRTQVDEPCGSVVNGPCAIPVGEYGRPGTRDDPMLALVASDYDSGTVVGVPAGSFTLEEGYCGYLIVGDYDGSTGTQRVIIYDNCEQSMMVRATECIKPGEGGTVQPLIWDDITECWVDDTNKSPVAMVDPTGWVLAITDECFKVERDHCTQRSFRPSAPYGLTRLVKVKTEIACGACGDVTLLKRVSGSDERCEMEESDCTIRACNVSYRVLACDAEEYATLHVSPMECCPDYGSGAGYECLAWLVPFPRALRASAVLSSDLNGSGTAAIGDVQFLDVCDWPVDTPVTEADTQVPRYACSGKKVELGWNDSTCSWEFVTVEPTNVRPVLDLDCPSSNCGNLQRERPTKDMWVEQGQSCGDTEWDDTKVTAEEIQYVEDGAFECTVDSCGLVLTKKTACVFCANVQDAGDTTLNGTSVDVAESIDASCSAGGSGSGDGSCSVVLKTGEYCVLGCRVGDGSSIDLGGTMVEVTDDTWFRQDGLSLKLTNCRTSICVLCADATNPWCDTDEVTGTDCGSGSGS